MTFSGLNPSVLNSSGVSIVVPVYNAADFVEETIESLLRQTYPDLQIIAVDDGSTDDSLRKLQKYAAQIKIITQANAGQAAALNHGWSLSAGAWLGYLSADDTLAPECIARMVAAISVAAIGAAAVAAYPAFNLMDERGRIFSRGRGGLFDKKRAILEWDCPVGPGLIFRRKIFTEAGGWDAQFRQIPDLEYLVRMAGLGEIVFVPDSLANFRVHSASQSSGFASANKADEPLVLFQKLNLRQAIPATWRAEAEGFSFALSARLHLRSGRWRTGVWRVAQAVRRFPPIVARAKFWRLGINAFFGRLKDQILRWKNKSA